MRRCFFDEEDILFKVQGTMLQLRFGCMLVLAVYILYYIRWSYFERVYLMRKRCFSCACLLVQKEERIGVGELVIGDWMLDGEPGFGRA